MDMISLWILFHPLTMDTFLNYGIQASSATKCEYIINDYREGPNTLDPSIIKTWWPETIVSNNGKQYTHKRVGHYNQVIPIFNIAYQPMPSIVFDDESSEGVSFSSENPGIVI